MPPVPLQQKIRSRIGPTYRRLSKRYDNPAIRHARLLVKRLRSGPIDILHLGASESLFTSPDDTDVRPLPQMYFDDLPAEWAKYSLAGPGHHPRIFKSYIEIVASYPSRPLVVLAFPIRLGIDVWEHHPEHGHERATAFLERIPPGSPPWRFHASIPLVIEEEYDRHDARLHPTLEGTTRTFGEYRRQVKDPVAAGLDRDEHLRRTFNFLHGFTAPVNDSYIESITALGARLRELGMPAVVMQTPIPMIRAVEVLGQEVMDRTVANWAVIDNAFIAGYGPIDVLQTGVNFATDEFLDPDDGIEHFNERGRRHLSDLIVEAIMRQKSGVPERTP
jgi:hypothetical protein